MLHGSEIKFVNGMRTARKINKVDNGDGTSRKDIIGNFMSERIEIN